MRYDVCMYINMIVYSCHRVPQSRFVDAKSTSQSSHKVTCQHLVRTKTKNNLLFLLSALLRSKTSFSADCFTTSSEVLFTSKYKL